jgi:hypothetical protein
MRYGDDGRQLELEVIGVRRRGRPVSVDGAATAAERQAARRNRLKNEAGKGVLTVEVSLDVIAALDAFVRFKDVTKGDVVDRILRGTLLRKR